MTGGIIAYPTTAGSTLTRVLEAGKGRETIVFLHGVGARADRWRQNLPAFAEAGYRCLALDLPGHGFAQKGAEFPYGVPGFSDFVENFLRQRSIEKVHFVGTSLGAHIAATIACRSPAQVSSLTLVGATGLFEIGPEARTNMATRIVDRSRAGIDRKLKVVMFDDSGISDDMVDEEWAINNSPGANEAFALLSEYFRDKIDGDAVGNRLAAMRDPIPTILIWGAEDKSVPLAIGHKAQKLLGGVPLTAIPRTAHAPYLENPAVFNGRVLEFLKGLRPD